MLKTHESRGAPHEVFDGLLVGLVKDRSQFYKDLAMQFYGANRPGANVSQGTGSNSGFEHAGGLKNAYRIDPGLLRTDFTERPPALVLHGDDQIVPVKNSAKKSAMLIKGAKELYHPERRGITATHQAGQRRSAGIPQS
jgi:non-heme chloroperoxidase